MDSEKLKIDMHVKNYYNSSIRPQYVQFLSLDIYFIYEGRMKITFFLPFSSKSALVFIYTLKLEEKTLYSFHNALAIERFLQISISLGDLDDG